MEFSNILRSAMADMTQADLVRKTGLSAATISRLLSGDRTPGYSTLIALKRALPKLRAVA